MNAYINELGQHVGKRVTIRGWVITTRSSGKIGFLVVRDGTGYLQAVLSRPEVPALVWARFGSLTQETCIAVGGVVRADPRSPGGHELTADQLEVLGASVDFPITPKEHGTQFLFEHRHLWLRSRRQVAVAKVRHAVIQAIHDFFDQRGFTQVDTPILTGSIGEEAGTLFATDYFDLGKAYLAHFCPGPLWLAPLLVPVEIIGLIAKVFALAVRLFANMIAGHILLESLGDIGASKTTCIGKHVASAQR